MVDQYTVRRVYLRLLLASASLVLRFIYGYYTVGMEIFRPGPIQASFFFWSAVIAILVYMVALPVRRNPMNHPGQRATDKATMNRRSTDPGYVGRASNSTKPNKDDQ